MVHIKKIKYRDEILVEQSIDVSKINAILTNKRIPILPDNKGLIDLSEYDLPYHIVLIGFDLLICLVFHKSSLDNPRIIWESDKALQDRVLARIFNT